jgi:hypothetical protein
MTPKAIDELLLELWREQDALAYAMNNLLYKATRLDNYDDDSDGVVVYLNLRETNTDRWTPTRRETLYVLRTDFDASPFEVITYHDGRTRNSRRNSNNEVNAAAYEYLADKVITAEDAIHFIDKNDTRAEGMAVTENLNRREEIKHLIMMINNEFNARGGWSRYFLVTSSNGHIHQSTSCHTCNKGKNATTFALVYHLSGEAADRAVEVFGPALCSACYPQAPVESREQGKVTTSLASVYYDEGYEGWLRAKAVADARKAKRAAKVGA